MKKGSAICCQPLTISWTVEEFEAAIEAVKEDLSGRLACLCPDGQADYRYLAFFWVFGASFTKVGTTAELT